MREFTVTSVALVSISAAYDVADYLDRTIPTDCPLPNVKAWEEVRDALYALSNDSDAIVIGESAADIEKSSTSLPLPENNIFTFLDLSTAHVSPDTRRWLEMQALAGATERGATHSVAAYREGWFVHAPSSEELVTSRDKFPADLLPILFHAAGIGAYYVRFDADADRDDRFQSFEDDESSLDGFPPEARAAIEAARANPEDAGIADELAEPGELNQAVTEILAAAGSGKEVVDTADFKELIEAANHALMRFDLLAVAVGKKIEPLAEKDARERLRTAIDAVT